MKREAMTDLFDPVDCKDYRYELRRKLIEVWRK